MNNQIISLFRQGALLLMLCSIFQTAKSQCVYTQITHTAGIEMVGCSEVTVISDGSVLQWYQPACAGYGPYYTGIFSDGSYTFNFSPPVSGVKIDVSTLDNSNNSLEEMVLYVNGAFYPANPGVPDGCNDPAVIYPPGTIRAVPNLRGSWKDIIIQTSITSLKIEDNVITGIPGGIHVSVYLCCLDCDTEAGNVNSEPLTICSPQPAEVPPAEQTALDADDLLQYILFTDPSDVTGSIIVTSNSPKFYFSPNNMSYGTTYYIAAIAGNGNGGNVDLDDPCLSISNHVPVVWQPLPTVEFTTNYDCLSPGAFYNINLNFTGTPPFHLIGQIVSGGTVITNIDNFFTSLSEVLTFYIPPTTPDGPLTIEALSLSDAYCTCD